MEYTLRVPSTKDLFLLMKIINKIGIKEVKALFSASEIQKMVTELSENGKMDEKTVATVGVNVLMDIVCLITEHLPECENEVIQFVANVSGLSKEEVSGLDMTTFAGMLIDVFNKEEIRDFFTVRFGLRKSVTSDSST